MTPEELKNKLIEIQSMGGNQLHALNVTIAMSNLDSKAKDFLYRAVEARYSEIDKSNAMVESDSFELDDKDGLL